MDENLNTIDKSDMIVKLIDHLIDTVDIDSFEMEGLTLDLREYKKNRLKELQSKTP